MKKLIMAASLAFALLLVATPALAIKPNGPAAENGLANPGTKHLELYEKNPSTWEPVEGGAWGRLNFSSETSPFTFNGHGLEPKADYTLVKYNGTDWPKAVCMANGTSNNGGNIHLSGTMDPYGDKVWLVTSTDVDCDDEKMTGWHPTEYLFEYDLI